MSRARAANDPISASVFMTTASLFASIPAFHAVATDRRKVLFSGQFRYSILSGEPI